MNRCLLFGMAVILAVLPGPAVRGAGMREVRRASVPEESTVLALELGARQVGPNAIRLIGGSSPRDIRLTYGLVGTQHEKPSHRAEEMGLSEDGSLVWFAPEEGIPYLRALDVETGAFLDTEPHMLSTQDVHLAMGRGQVAVFVELDRATWFVPPAGLRLERIAFVKNAWHIESIWEENHFTQYIASDMNSRGDVVALLAHCRIDKRGELPRRLCDAYSLVLFEVTGRIKRWDIQPATTDSDVAISEDGNSIAVYSSHRGEGIIRLFTVAEDSENALRHSLRVCVPGGRHLVAVALALSDRQEVAVAFYNWDGNPPAPLKLVVVQPEGSCEFLRTFEGSVVSIDLRYHKDRLYAGVVDRFSVEESLVYEFEPQ